MRIARLIILLSAILSTASLAGVYRWVDNNGNVIYGDNPPKNTPATPVELPALTVADPLPAQSPPTAKSETPALPEEEKTTYSEFKITSPTAEEGLRANDGTITVTLGIKPELKLGDGVVLYLDGKQVASGKQLNFELKELDRGEHTVFAVLNDARGNIIQNTETVKFNVLRTSVLLKK